MERSTAADVERALERLFRLTNHRGLQRSQLEVVGVDVTRAGYAVLRSLEGAGELTLGDLARACSMDPATVTRQVRLLERDSLVRRRLDASDARVARVRLTTRGRSVYRTIVEFRTRYMRDVLADWSASDRGSLVSLVDRLVERLETVRPAEKENN